MIQEISHSRNKLTIGLNIHDETLTKTKTSQPELNNNQINNIYKEQTMVKNPT